jgi:ADP-heptose:LPS heptosyltransferase
MSYKRWPEDRFIETARILSHRFNCRTVIFGGPGEKETAAAVADSIGYGAVTAAGYLTIRESFEVMKYAALFISNDSGPMHLAAAAGCPVVAIFGPTMDHKTAPLGNQSVILTSDVLCRPCYRYKPVTCSTLECLKKITVEMVVTEAEKMLSKKQP